MKDTTLGLIIAAIAEIESLVGRLFVETDPDVIATIYSDIKNINRQLVRLGEQLERLTER